MKKKELIEALSDFSDETEIMILDGFNGGGVPRELNLGPVKHKITYHETEETADCENKTGQIVVVIGFGCY